MTHLRFATLIGLPFLLLVGCEPAGPQLGEVTGTVTLDGKPLPEATVVFQPLAEDGSPSRGETREDGTYVLYYTDREGALIGEHEVRITTGRQKSTDEGGGIVPEKLLPKYHAETELKKTVEKGNNTIDFPLESK